VRPGFATASPPGKAMAEDYYTKQGESGVTVKRITITTISFLAGH